MKKRFHLGHAPTLLLILLASLVSVQGLGNDTNNEGLNDTLSDLDIGLSNNCTSGSSVPNGFREFYAPADIFDMLSLYRCNQADGAGLSDTAPPPATNELCSWEQVMKSCCKCSTDCCMDLCENITLAEDVLAILTVVQDDCDPPTSSPNVDGRTTISPTKSQSFRPLDMEECQDTPGWEKYRGRQAPWNYRYFYCDDNDVECDTIGNLGSAGEHCCKCFPQCGGQCVEPGAMSIPANIGTIAFSFFVVSVGCFLGYGYHRQTNALRQTRRIMAERRRRMREGNRTGNGNDEVDMEARMQLILSRFHIQKVPPSGMDGMMFTPSRLSSRTLRVNQTDLQQMAFAPNLDDIDYAPFSRTGSHATRSKDSADRSVEEVASGHQQEGTAKKALQESNARDDEGTPTNQGEVESTASQKVPIAGDNGSPKENSNISKMEEASREYEIALSTEDEDVPPNSVFATTTNSMPSSLDSDDGEGDEEAPSTGAVEESGDGRRLSFAVQETPTRRGSNASARSGSRTKSSFLSIRGSRSDEMSQPVSPRNSRRVSRRDSGRRGSRNRRPSLFGSIWKKATCKDECSICLEEYLPGEVVCLPIKEECKHLFHQECIVEWLKRDDRCPLCRVDLMTEEVANSDEVTDS